MIRTAFLLAALLASARASAQTDTALSVTASDAVFANPERGIYRYSEARSGAYVPLDIGTLRGYRQQQAVTLVFRYFYLENFKASEISADYLQKMQADFDALREAGLKGVVRFAYTSEDRVAEGPPYGDAPKSVILGHIEQVAPLLQANADVIAIVQAGFIGTWGEWYYSDYFANPNNPDDISDAQQADRRGVLLALLDALPEERMTQVRYVRQKQILFGTGMEPEDALDFETAYSGAPVARTGIHNDCFLASPTDYGTFDAATLAADQAYLARDSRFTPVGGETCNPNPPRSECASTLADLERYHWSYLNRDYHPTVVAGWIQNGCYPEIQKRLGYRLRLDGGTVTTATAPGAGVRLDLDIVNDGWAAPYNPRAVEAWLRSEATGARWRVRLPDDPRFWLPDSAVALRHTIGLPADLPEGDYDLLLGLPDPAPTLYGTPAFSVRLANEGLWEEATGLHRLATLTVAGGAGGVPFTGGLTFAPADDATNAAPPPESGWRLGVPSPNPADAAVRVPLAVASGGPIAVEVVDSMGRVVARVGSTHADVRLDTRAWAAGVYLVRATGADGVQTRSFTVSR